MATLPIRPWPIIDENRVWPIMLNFFLNYAMLAILKLVELKHLLKSLSGYGSHVHGGVNQIKDCHIG